GEAVPGQIQLDVQREAGVTARQDNAVTARLRRVTGVVPHRALEQQVGGRSKAHRGRRVARARLLHRVHRQGTYHVDGPTVEIAPLQGRHEIAAQLLDLQIWSCDMAPG